MAADPFSGAVAQVLLGEIVAPGWKSAKQHLSSLKVEVFAQNCGHVCILTHQPTCSPAGSPGAPHTEPAGAPTRFILAWTLLLSSCGQDGWSKGSLYFCSTGELTDKVDPVRSRSWGWILDLCTGSSGLRCGS